jgi:hypothetical protein
MKVYFRLSFSNSNDIFYLNCSEIILQFQTKCAGMIVENPLFQNVVKNEFAEEHNTEGTVRESLFQTQDRGPVRKFL